MRVLYDGTNELFNLFLSQYPNYLCGMGIRCKVFSRYIRYSPHITITGITTKIVVIDGKVAFTGAH